MGALADIATGIPVTAAGSILAPGVTTAIAPAGTFVPAIGVYYCWSVGADVKFQVQDSDGGGTWHDITAAGAKPTGVVYSDGTNMRFINGGVGSENVVLQRIG